jgi:hypothetical protein
MVQYSATIGTTTAITGSSSIILVLNQLPTGGECLVSNRTSGIALSTYFIVICTNWIDPDGQIVSYELNGIFLKSF